MPLPFWQTVLWELLGTGTLILLGAGVVANTTLRGTLGHGTNWLLITLAWGFAVFTGASVAAPSGAHLNPAVTAGLLCAGQLPWSAVPAYLLGQFTGAFLGAVLCWLAYKPHFDAHDEPRATLGIFATGPAIRALPWNLVTEVIGTFVLVFWVLTSPAAKAADSSGVPQFGNSALGYAAVAFVVIAVGASLGGPTGYAINPARDLGPRLAYAVLPIRGKGDPDWPYAWVPVLGPLLGATAAGLLYRTLPV
ncbi:MIP/aquaporin family protein [Actinokineospora auranticolor]|uniref:Glycerol uptake facilitator protein n=1 Tax=Actinokineospora auranticolor TaxID=155976 RepID=A0A2S6GX43_9PSEU|nr:MIP/aquaporin family protein [Actinokineospora auranticolor]PPK69756.1 glycerol uptake facilitator protein [Actinokineospora auranticolor]